jgi:hypothetical protein
MVLEKVAVEGKEGMTCSYWFCPNAQGHGVGSCVKGLVVERFGEKVRAQLAMWQ